jgi:hypothetical protein
MPVHDENGNKKGKNDADFPDEISHAPRNSLLDFIHIVGHAGHEFTRGHLIEIICRLVHDMRREVIPQFFRDLQSDGFHEKGRKEGEEPFAEQDDHKQQWQHDGVLILRDIPKNIIQKAEFLDRNFGAELEQLIHDRLDHIHENEREKRHKKGEKKGKDKSFPLLESEFEELENIFHHFAYKLK